MYSAGMSDAGFVDYIVSDVLRFVPKLTTRAMFGGYGVYSRGVIIACVMNDEFYLKVGDSNRPDFERAGSHPFVYEKKSGGTSVMSYWLVPEEVMNDADVAAEWAEKAYRVSLAVKK